MIKMSVFSAGVMILTLPFAAFAAEEYLPAFRDSEGRVLIDTEVYRIMTLNQRLWSLQDQRRRHEADLLDAAAGLQSLISGSGLGAKRARMLGISDPGSVRSIVNTADSGTLRRLLDSVHRYVEDTTFKSLSLASNYAGPLKKSLIARTQMETIDAEMKRLKADLSVVEGGR